MIIFRKPNEEEARHEFPYPAARDLVDTYGEGAMDVEIIAPRSLFLTTWDFVEAILKRGKIKVVALNNPQRPIVASDGTKLPVSNAWRICDKDGATDLRVVDNFGLTIVDANDQMLTSWHIGISPGDLARRYVPRIDVERPNRKDVHV